MVQNYEMIVKGIRNFENKVTVTLAFYEAAARRSIRQVFLDVATGLCGGDEQSPEKRPIILEAQSVWITYKGKLPGRITGSLKTPPKW